ncbi:hypothetical protein [Roseofilum reptotaenium]|uniref:hypothetical protein n=1 Tax=Roseofilum reptotaenium TaxID=1233427 RepID=UPI000AF1DB14|nr:hypothetical protein [Roseofilum reptotaenium]
MNPQHIREPKKAWRSPTGRDWIYSVSLFYEVQLEALEPKPYKLLQSKPIA